MKLSELKAIWNARADEFNQWDSLGVDEIVALAVEQQVIEYADLIHYPGHWDTAAYPTLESAVRESLACAWCSERSGDDRWAEYACEPANGWED